VEEKKDIYSPWNEEAADVKSALFEEGAIKATGTGRVSLHSDEACVGRDSGRGEGCLAKSRFP